MNKCESNPLYGAVIERGRIKASEENGYRVMSYGRHGFLTPPLKAMDEGLLLEVGDMVYFFLFDDGTGLILARID